MRKGTGTMRDQWTTADVKAVAWSLYQIGREHERLDFAGVDPRTFATEVDCNEYMDAYLAELDRELSRVQAP